VEAFTEVFQVIFDLLFRNSDGEGDLFCAMGAFFQEGADPAPYRFLLSGGR
jgi:hypothetical protein